MKKYFLAHFIFILFLVSCITTEETVKQYNSPLDYPPQHQVIYKLNKAEDIYWRIVDTKNPDNIDIHSLDILLSIPNEWKDEIKQMAIELYLNKHGE